MARGAGGDRELLQQIGQKCGGGGGASFRCLGAAGGDSFAISWARYPRAMAAKSAGFLEMCWFGLMLGCCRCTAQSSPYRNLGVRFDVARISTASRFLDGWYVEWCLKRFAAGSSFPSSALGARRCRGGGDALPSSEGVETRCCPARWPRRPRPRGWGKANGSDTSASML